MKKKLLALVCMMTVLVCAVFAAAPKADAADHKYQVGYARVDVNPYNVDGDFSSGIMQLPLRGSGDVWNRLSTAGLVDDNGDGVIDANDGLKATCVAITDETGKTVLLINIDLIGGTMISKVNAAIVARVEAALASGELSGVSLAKEDIYYGGTHTHNAPDTTVYASGGKTGTNSDGVELGPINENLGIWINRTVEDVADAAILALQDRAAATITRDQLSASDATDPVVKGKKMVTTRHLVNGEDGSIAGDNFNDRGNNPKQITEADDTIYLLKFSFQDANKLPVIFTGWRGHPSLNNSNSYENSGTKCMSSDYVNAYRHALEFGVKVTIDTEYGVGHVASWELGDTQKYRVIFFNGTGGNTNPRNTEVMRDENGNALTYGSGTTMRGYSWIDVSASKAEIKGRACSYGVVLATMAQECLDDGKNASAVPYGQIKTMKKSFTTPRKTAGISQLSHNAGVAYQASDKLYDTAYAEYNKVNSKFSAYKTAYNDYKDAGVLGFLYKSKMETALKEYNSANSTYTSGSLKAYEDYMAASFTNAASQASTTTVNGTYGPTKPLQTHPMIYKQEDGQTFAVGSRFHASNLVSSWNTNLDIPKTGNITVTLNAFMVGEELAFVVIPGEPFDYYYKERGIYTPENNLWQILNDDTYGKPIVLGYTNGADGYFPNIEAYYYNEGRTDKAIGSYETQNNTKEAGHGEQMIYELRSMLAVLNGEDRTAYCEHCKQDAVWTPFKGQTLETGHYYLCSDYNTTQMKIADGMTVCFDLNGYTYTGATRAFYNDQNAKDASAKATLSIMDSSKAKTGVVTGCGGELGAARGYGGGTIIMGMGHELNIYGGTITSYEHTLNSASSGTVLLIRGTLNMYGGQIIGGKTSSAKGDFWYSSKVNTVDRTGMGGALYLSGTLNMYGGKITGGSYQMITNTILGNDDLGHANQLVVEACEGVAPCVCVTTYSSHKGVVNLYNDASIEHIYFNGLTETQLHVYGNYTGTAQVQFSGKTELAAGSLIGSAKADGEGNPAYAARSNITVTGVEGLVGAVSGDTLVLAEKSWNYGYCRACDTTVQWQPMTAADWNQYNGTGSGATKLPAGHYRMDENVQTDQKQLNSTGEFPGSFCIDLAGHTFTGKTRAFYVYDDAVLNIYDSVGGGLMEGRCGNTTGGGVIYVQGAAVANLYGGTVRHNSEAADHVLNGGCIRVNGGTFRMYGGTLEGENVSEHGGAIYASVRSSVPGKVEILGGTVIGAAAAKGGNGIYLAKNCTVKIAGDAQIEDIYIAGDPVATLTLDTTEAPFGGILQITCATQLGEGEAFGTCLGANGITGTVTLSGSTLPTVISGGKLITLLERKNFHLMSKNGIYATFDTFEEALEAYTYEETLGNYILLTKDVSKPEIYKDVYLDLGGFYLNQPTILDCVTLYCMDSQTNDFTIEDDWAYGMVYDPTIDGEGAVVGITSESAVADSGYLRIREGKGYSFHRVILDIKAMSFRPSAAGVYYTCDFKGDEIVSENIKSFGIALSAWLEPDAMTLDEMCLYTASTEFAPGAAGNSTNGVLLSGIMKQANSAEKNRQNGELAVYGRAYIETEDGYTFGASVARSLKDQLESINGIWDKLTDGQKASLVEFVTTYKEAVEGWNISNIK